MGFAGSLITIVFLWEDPWLCLWEQNLGFNYIPSGYSDYILLRILFLWLSSTQQRYSRVQQRKCLGTVYIDIGERKF